MKTRLLIYLIIILCVIISLTSLNLSDKKYFYAYGKKIELIEKPNTLLVKYYKNIEKDKAKKLLK